jgi:hypothetical protein
MTVDEEICGRICSGSELMKEPFICSGLRPHPLSRLIMSPMKDTLNNDVLASTISPKTLYAGPKLPNRKFITSLGDL